MSHHSALQPIDQMMKAGLSAAESFSSRVWPRKLIPIQNHLTREWIAHWKRDSKIGIPS